MMEHFSESRWSKREATMRCSSLVTYSYICQFFHLGSVAFK